jgi:flagellar protein FliT
MPAADAMSAHPLLGHYESLCALTRQKRIAVERGEWDRLIELEQQCTQQVEHIKSFDAKNELDETARLQVVQFIRTILAEDTEIRSQTEAWREQLQNIMQSNRQEQRLNQTYGAAG